MNMHNKIYESKLFSTDVNIKSQIIKIIQFSTPLGQDFDLDSDNLTIDYNYHMLDNKTDNRDFIIILEFSLKEINSSEEDQNCFLNVVIEGMYRLRDDLPQEEFSKAKHFGGLALLVNYLKTVVFNITSMTTNKGLHLPLINVNELHSKHIEENKKVTKRTVAKKKTK